MANKLGVRQEAETVIPVNDIDGNEAFDILLNSSNSVDIFAASNQQGEVLMTNDQSLSVGFVGPFEDGDVENIVFAPTIGLVAENDVSISSTTGSLQIVNDIVASESLLLQSANAISIGGVLNATSVRIVGSGDIFQLSNGSVDAVTLGVRQQGLTVSDETDLDDNGRLDVILDGENNTNELAIGNIADGGAIAFNNLDEFTIGIVPDAATDNSVFVETAGISTSLANQGNLGASDLDTGDILLQAVGGIRIEAAIIAGDNPDTIDVEENADLRLVLGGSLSLIHI